MAQTAVFRVDASTVIGTGHVMRCLTLAAKLETKGVRASFIARSSAGDLTGAIRAAGFAVDTLPERSRFDALAEALDEAWETDAQQSLAAIRARHGRVDWLIVDHYGLDARWEGELKRIAANIMVIDDLANRRHECDVLLDQNLHPKPRGRYEGLIPSRCRRLLEPRYALLRAEFTAARERLRRRDGSVRRLLVFFGGADQHDETSKTLEAVRSLDPPELAVDVIVGVECPHRDAIRARWHGDRTRVHCGPPNIAELMAHADLAIGATGATSWERLCLGLPAIVVSLAANQESSARALAGEGLAVYLGKRESVTSGMIAGALAELMGDPDQVEAMGRAGLERVDGRGADRVARALDAKPIALRPAVASDRDAVYEWRNAEETRRHSHTSAPIAPDAHAQWFERTLADASRMLLIAECGGEAVGVLRYDCAEQQTTVSIYLVPGQHGRGYGPRLLDAGHAWLRSHRPGVTAVRAEVLPGNRASAAAFAQSGYDEVGGVYIKELG